MQLPEELVLIIVKLAGHTAYESAVKCCKNWRAWIKRDIKKDKRAWDEIFNDAVKWYDDGEYWGLPEGVRHGIEQLPKDNPSWKTRTNYYRGLRHGAMLVREETSGARATKITRYLWNKGELLSSSQHYMDEAFLSLMRGLAGSRYAN